MSQIEGLKKELARIRQQNRELKSLLKRFTLADKGQKILDGVISSDQEFDEYGMRFDGGCSRYIFDKSDTLEKSLELMLPVDRRDTSNLETLFKIYPTESILDALLKYDLQGFEIAD